MYVHSQTPIAVPCLADDQGAGSHSVSRSLSLVPTSSATPPDSLPGCLLRSHSLNEVSAVQAQLQVSRELPHLPRYVHFVFLYTTAITLCVCVCVCVCVCKVWEPSLSAGVAFTGLFTISQQPIQCSPAACHQQPSAYLLYS